MRHRRWITITSLALLAAGCGLLPGAPAPALKSPLLSRTAQQASAKSIISNARARYAPNQILIQASGLSESDLPVRGAKILETFQGYQRVKLPSGTSVAQALDACYADDRIQGAQPLVLHEATEDQASPSTTPSLNSASNDPDLFQQWWLDKVHAPEAWTFTKGSSEVTVAVLDTGVDYNHPDLAGQVINGPDFGENTQDSLDKGGHGTHVAGIIAAKNNNGIGGSGLAPDCKVMAIKVFKPYFDDGGQYQGFYADDLDIAKGIYYAATHGAKIINMSLGGHGLSTLIKSVCSDAAGRGVLVVVAAGNDHENDLSNLSPAGVDSVIPVVATDARDQITGFSNFGRMDALAAPGQYIYSTTPTYKPKYGNGHTPLNYAYLDGTSMAAPVVAGEAALVTSLMLQEVRDFLASREVHIPCMASDLPADEIANAMRYSAVDLGARDRDPVYGYGRIDAAAALRRIQDPDVIKEIANKVYRAYNASHPH
jgi:thermitase